MAQPQGPEEVLVVPRQLLAGLGLTDGISFDGIERFLSTIRRSYSFVDRGLAESTDELKQIIPYVMLRYSNFYFLFRRKRGGNEAGLWDKYSIGFGGHMNPSDAAEGTERLFSRSLERELREELTLESGFPDYPVALLNDDGDPVGRRHFGLVYMMEVPQPEVSIREQKELVQIEGGFLPLSRLREYAHQMESWSRLLVECTDPRLFAR